MNRQYDPSTKDVWLKKNKQIFRDEARIQREEQAKKKRQELEEQQRQKYRSLTVDYQIPK